MRSAVPCHHRFLPHSGCRGDRTANSTKRLWHQLLFNTTLLACGALYSQPLPPAYRAAEKALSRGDLPIAHDLLHKLIHGNPPLPRAYERLAESYIDSQRIPEGIEVFQKLLNLRPGAANAHGGLAMLYNSVGNTDSALAHGLQAVGGGAPIIPACEIAVHLARSQKKDALLDAQLEARLTIRPNDLAAGYARAYVAYADGRLKEAEAELDVLQKHFPRDWRLFHLRSIVEIEHLPIAAVLTSIQKGLTHAKSAGDNEGIAAMLFRRVCAHLLRNDAPRADASVKQLNTMSKLSEKTQRLASLAAAMRDQVTSNFDAAIAGLKELRAHALAQFDGNFACIVGWTMARTYLQAGNFSAAEYIILHTKTVADSLVFLTHSLREEAFLGYARERLGFYDIAKLNYEAVEKQSQRMGTYHNLPYVWSGLARISLYHYYDIDAAIRFRMKELKLSRKLERWDLEMDSLVELARAYHRKNDLDSTHQALDMTSKLLSIYQTPRDLLNFWLLQGDVEKKERNYDQALNAYENALAISPRFGPLAPVLVYMKIGDLLLHHGDCEGAVQAYRQAYDSILRRIGEEGLEKGRLDLSASREVITTYVKGLVKCGKFTEGLEKARQSQMLVLRESEVAQERTRRAGGDKELALIRKVDSLSAELAKLDGNEAATEPERLETLNQIDLLRQRLGDFSSQGGTRVDTTWCQRFLHNDVYKLDTLQKSLAEQNAVALVYLVGANAVIAFALHPDTLLARIIPGFDRLSLRALVKRINPLLAFDRNALLSKELKSHLQFDIDRLAARELVDNFFHPLLMGRKPQKLIMMLDDVLCALPFDALLLAADSSGIELDKLPVMQVGLDFRDIFSQASLDSARALIMANGQSIQAPGEDYALPPLKFVAHEAEGIAEHIPNGSYDLLLNEHATREDFRTTAKNYDVLHLAMHASLSDWSPEYSRLHFYSVNKKGEPLYGYEISQLRLRAALTVLSACNTALGRFRPGYGLLSFVLNFIDAGVPSVVASLWQVDEKTTEMLMVEFYEQVCKGRKFSEALALAKQHLIKEGYADPYYWAGFVLYGKDGSVNFAPSPSVFRAAFLPALLIFSILLLALFWIWRQRQLRIKHTISSADKP